MKTVKSAIFAYDSTEETQELLATFRMMVNHAIHLALDESIRGRFRLRDRIYQEFRDCYGVVSCYPYSVAEVAWSIIKKHRRWHRRPSASRLMLKMDASNYSLKNGILSLPNKLGRRVFITLRSGDYQRSLLTDRGLKMGQVTMTETSIAISFWKETNTTVPIRLIGYDLNHKSIVGSDGTRIDLSTIARLHTEYGVRRSEFSQRHPNDRRLRHKFSATRRERERITQSINRVSKQIVERALNKREGIVLERLIGIRRTSRKGSMTGRDARRRANLWPFRELQWQIAYKAGWAGIPVEFVSPWNTSKECANCHYINKKLKVTEKSWQCPRCGCRLDRDLNAAVNIERRGKMPCLGEVRPGAQSKNEAVKGNETMTPILGAEALRLGVGPMVPRPTEP